MHKIACQFNKNSINWLISYKFSYYVSISVAYYSISSSRRSGFEEVRLGNGFNMRKSALSASLYYIFSRIFPYYGSVTIE